MAELSVKFQVIGFDEGEQFFYAQLVGLGKRCRLFVGRRCASLQKQFTVLLHLTHVFRRGVFKEQIVLLVLVARLVIHFACHTACCKQRTRHTGWCPMTALPNLPRFVHIVGITQKREAVGVVKNKQESTTQIAAFSATSQFHIGDNTSVILGLQIHVHHIFSLFCIVAQRTIEVALLLIHLDGLDSIVGKVFQEYLAVASEETSLAKQQLIHLAAIDKDFTGLIHRHTGELLNHFVQHGAFGQIECIGIIHDGITLVEHLYLSSCHCHIVKVDSAHFA